MPTTWSEYEQQQDRDYAKEAAQTTSATEDFLSRLRISAGAGTETSSQPAFPEPDLTESSVSATAGPSSSTAFPTVQNPPIAPGPRLPPEILLQILLSPELSPTLHPSPLTFSTLQSLLCTSRLCNHCAKEQLYSVIILPRRVRDFRRYYDKEREKGWPGIGLCKGLFCALDDVSRLTHTSAGWESSFLRMLHILGPSITHLSIWHAESRTLLRDAGQIRGKRRLGARGPAWSWGEGNSSSSDDSDDETIIQPPDDAAQRERAQQTLPLWLQRELASSTSQNEVLKRHRAHFSPYESVKKDKRKLKGCRPISLSLILSLPLFENQEAELFASMIIFSKVEELDVFIPVPAHTSRLLRLLGHLHKSPLKRIKISTTHASLCMGLAPFNEKGKSTTQHIDIDLAAVLTAFLDTSTALHDTLLSEFAGKHIDDNGLPHLERLLVSTALHHGQRQQPTTPSASISRNGPLKAGAGQHSTPTRNGGLASTLHFSPQDTPRHASPPPIRIRIFQRNQAHYGKLKDRMTDFIRRTAPDGGHDKGLWSQCGMWDVDQE